MSNFSQRMGIVSLKKIQINCVDQNLKTGLWNELYDCILKHSISVTFSYNIPEIYEQWCLFYRYLYKYHFKEQIDNFPESFSKLDLYLEDIKDRFYKFSWNEVYDFIEAILGRLSFLSRKDGLRGDISEHFKKISNHFLSLCNLTLERELSGYRLIENQFIPLTNFTELKEIDKALANSESLKLEGVKKHIKTALELLSKKPNPDCRNSMKESISAIESICKIIAQDKNATLGAALKVISNIIPIHEALQKGFEKIYGYTSDQAGIRHALIQDDNCNTEDAIFMIVSCSAFVNYLIEKSRKAGVYFIN